MQMTRQAKRRWENVMKKVKKHVKMFVRARFRRILGMGDGLRKKSTPVGRLIRGNRFLDRNPTSVTGKYFVIRIRSNIFLFYFYETWVISRRYTRMLSKHEFISISPPPRAITPTKADQFFDQLGFHTANSVASLSSKSNKSSPVFFDWTSTTTGSHSRHSHSDHCSQAAPTTQTKQGQNKLGIGHTHECSIVEKNARIIKWLFQCRRAQASVLL